MPNKEFLEQYPLYRRFKTDSLPEHVDGLEKVPLSMSCPTCKSNQTFVMINEYSENCDNLFCGIEGMEFRLKYVCVHCGKFERYFFVKVTEGREYLVKIGQWPPWDITADRNIERLLGERADYFKKGLVCESQSYGIAAFAYYRRIVEEIISELLEEISELMDGEEKDRFLEAIEEAKKTPITQDKIALVKDLLPPILRPEGMNPLSTLHSILSEGLHAESDEACMQYAMAVREVLLFLVNQVSASRATSKSFTAGMKKLLEKKAKQSN